MGIVRRIKRRFGWQPTPIEHGHVYIDTLTGGRLEVVSVRRAVHIVRLDASRNREVRIRKPTMRDAIDDGYIEHDPDRCPTCRSQQTEDAE